MNKGKNPTFVKVLMRTN